MRQGLANFLIGLLVLMGRAAISLAMRDPDWTIPLEVFRASLMRRGDKGHDSASNRKAVRDRGAVPVIPFRKNVRNHPAFFPRLLHRARARIGQTIEKLKRIALRCEKIARNFRAFVEIAAAFIIIKSVHTAEGLSTSTSAPQKSKSARFSKKGCEA